MSKLRTQVRRYAAAFAVFVVATTAVHAGVTTASVPPEIGPATALSQAVRNPTSVPRQPGTPPTVDPPVSGDAADEFVRRVTSQSDAHAHPDDPARASEHMALLRLVPRMQSTHVAITDGNWTDPDTWYRGDIPADLARVLVPEGVSVEYDAHSDASLFTVRVDGELHFATERDTQLVVDTLVVAPSGRLEIGTAATPVGPSVSAEVLIAPNGDIDTAWDPILLSRGIVSHGAAEIHGAQKQPFTKVSETPRAGDRSIDLAEPPEGWRVGDVVVLTGTKQLGWFWDNSIRAGRYHESQDEVRTITAIDAATITIDRPLAFDHATPREDLAAYVANTSRSITVRSIGGDSVPVHQRGHTMFMHSDDVDVRYAAFDHLGRTDKSVPAGDLSLFDEITPTTNIKGRYSVHFHKTGTERQDDPALLIGNSVTNSPGWGYAHHSSHANFTDNVAFDVFGAAFAAEDGDETGIWLRNIAIKSEGIGWGDWTVKQGPDTANHDNGRTGDGYFFAGRLVEAAENVAANTTNGFVWFHRGPRTGPATSNLQHGESAYGARELQVNVPAIEGFRDNEAFATHSGIIVIKANPTQRHDVRSVFDGFLNWETREGVNLSYTAHYTMKDFDLVGLTELEPFQDRRAAFHVGTNASDIVVNGISAERFEVGLHFGGNRTTFESDGERGHVVIDATYIDVDTEFTEAVPGSVEFLESSDLVDRITTFDMTSTTDLRLGDTLYLDGTKTDSIGSTDRQIETDRHRVGIWPQLTELLVDQGYWTLADGTKVVLLYDIVSDRASGDVEKIVHVVRLDATDNELRNAWWFNQVRVATYNGQITLGGPAPIALPDAERTSSFADVVIDVVANDTDPDGGVVSTLGATDPAHGDVTERGDGTFVYRSNLGFTGTDRFDYWVTDEEGNLARSTVTVTVTADPVSSARSLRQASASTAVASSDAATMSFVCSPLTVLRP